MVFIQFPFEGKVRCVFQDLGTDSSKVHTFISSCLGSDDFRIYCNGKELLKGQEVFHDATVQVTFSLPGGKGGFGSMLRAIGAQIEKTTNREACRDLSGRRLRDINEEQRLKKWIAKESEREEEKMRRRKERIERLKARPRHNFVDFEYEKEISALPERIDDALTAGMQKVAKRPADEGESSQSTSHTKKKCLWLDEGLSDSSGSDSESFGKTNSSIDTACSSTSVQNENISHTLGSESSVGESSNCSTSCEPNIGVTAPVMQDQVSSDMKEVSTSGDDSLSGPENQSTSPPIQDDLSSDVISDKTTTPQEIKNEEDDSPIDLLSFNSLLEMEALGLNRLKSALMVRRLKCGGNISDRALRLWKVRGLQPKEYPKNFLAKGKK